MRELGAGALLGSWLIEERRGRGGFAEVFRARHIGDGRVAALKVLGRAQTAAPQLVRRFEQEGEILLHLRHPAIPAVLERGVATDGRPWLAMEWIDGTDLASELTHHGRMGLHEALALLAPLADALDAAHRAGVVHRDLKPANVLLEATTDGRRARLIDFGIAKPLDARVALAHTGDSLVGTPRHMAPEQLLGRGVDARTDVYAFGLLLFEMLSGRATFIGAELAEQLEAQHLRAPPPAISEYAPVPAALDAPLRRCLAKEPAQRPASVGEALAELRAAAREAARSPASATSPAPAGARELLIEARLRDDLDEPSDEDLDDIDRALQLARALCHAAGVSLWISGGSMLLATAEDAQALHALATTLRQRLAELPARSGRVRVVVQLRPSA